jgi:hypothetical protein
MCCEGSWERYWKRCKVDSMAGTLSSRLNMYPYLIDGFFARKVGVIFCARLPPGRTGTRSGPCPG